jgi:hypothetical protein
LFTPARKAVGMSMATTPSMAMVRYTRANNVNFTPGSVSSRTSLARVYGNGRESTSLTLLTKTGSAPRRPPWK